MTDWKPLIAEALQKAWPAPDYPLPKGVEWVHAQMMTESNGQALAISSVGAKGLMQLMPATASEVGVRDPFNPQDSLRGGIAYLRKQYERLPEIPEPQERYYWSLAAYNCGLGYVNRALKLARLDEEPFWWKWNPGRYFLMSRECIVAGRWPIYRQVFEYLARIQKRMAL